MDPEAFLDVANQVIKLKMFPYFDVAHSLLCALAVREDLGAGKSRLFTNLYYIPFPTNPTFHKHNLKILQTKQKLFNLIFRYYDYF